MEEIVERAATTYHEIVEVWLHVSQESVHEGVVEQTVEFSMCQSQRKSSRWTSSVTWNASRSVISKTERRCASARDVGAHCRRSHASARGVIPRSASRSVLCRGGEFDTT